MRGYAGISLALSACIHFVRNDEVGSSIVELAAELKTREIVSAYVDYRIVSESNSNIADRIGDALGLEHAPYPAARRYGVRFPWVPFLDDLIGLSEQVSGVVIVIDNADLLFAEARNDAFDLIEAFLIQFENWHEKKKPCHLCFQMEKNELIRQVFQPA